MLFSIENGDSLPFSVSDAVKVDFSRRSILMTQNPLNGTDGNIVGIESGGIVKLMDYRLTESQNMALVTAPEPTILWLSHPAIR